MTDQHSDPKPTTGDDVTLTPEDDVALDHAWESITDAEIAESMTWLKQQPPPRNHREQPHE
jgi:hypothetical protein